MAIRRTRRPTPPIDRAPDINVPQYITPNLMTLLLPEEGYRQSAAGDRYGTQIGFGFNRGDEKATLQEASDVLGRTVTRESKISHAEALELAAVQVGHKLQDYVARYITMEKFDALPKNVQGSILSVLYNGTHQMATKFAMNISDKINQDRTKEIPALIANYATMPGTKYHKDLVQRRSDEARLALLPDGANFTSRKQIQDYSNPKKDIPVEQIVSLIRPDAVAAAPAAPDTSAQIEKKLPVELDAKPAAPPVRSARNTTISI